MIGYKLDPAYQGKGIMSAVLKGVLAWVEEWLGVGSIAAVSPASSSSSCERKG